MKKDYFHYTNNHRPYYRRDLMTLDGKDAVTMASTVKYLLTADTLNQSFQGVGGKITSVQVTRNR